MLRRNFLFFSFPFLLVCVCSRARMVYLCTCGRRRISRGFQLGRVSEPGWQIRYVHMLVK